MYSNFTFKMHLFLFQVYEHLDDMYISALYAFNARRSKKRASDSLTGFSDCYYSSCVYWKPNLCKSSWRS